MWGTVRNMGKTHPTPGSELSFSVVHVEHHRHTSGLALKGKKTESYSAYQPRIRSILDVLQPRIGAMLAGC